MFLCGTRGCAALGHQLDADALQAVGVPGGTNTIDPKLDQVLTFLATAMP